MLSALGFLSTSSDALPDISDMENIDILTIYEQLNAIYTVLNWYLSRILVIAMSVLIVLVVYLILKWFSNRLNHIL